MLTRLTRTVLRHKRLIAVGWILLTIVGMAAAGPASKALDQRFSVPGREGWETSQDILRVYGNGGESPPFLPVVHLPEGTTASDPQVRSELRRVERVAQKAVPGSRVAGYGSTGDPTFTSKDGRTAFIYVFPKRSDDPFAGNVDSNRDLRNALRGQTVAGSPVVLTGYDALQDSSGNADDGPGVLVEALLGGFGALIVLAFVF
jgi:RND superfamily putative drug exporter